jgi:hypothetical protein
MKQRFRDGHVIRQVQENRTRPKLFGRLCKRYKEMYESAKLNAAGIAAVPATKVLQLYGLDEVPGPTKSIAQKAEAFKKRHPWLGWIADVASWSVIGFDMACLGAQLSRRLAMIGPMLSDMAGYTTVMTHPSIASATVQKARSAKSKPGVSQYIQACSIPDIAATPLSLGVLCGVVHSGVSGGLSTGRAVAAVALYSVVDFTVWAAGFVPYWAKVIRRERGIGLLNSIKSACIGLLHPFRKGKPDNAWEEAGRVVGIGATVWAPPVYLMHVAVAAFLAIAGIEPAAFNQAFFATTRGVLGLIRYVFTGIKVTLVERMIKRNNETV